MRSAERSPVLLDDETKESSTGQSGPIHAETSVCDQVRVSASTTIVDPLAPSLGHVK
jgi:hypothetical protein